MNTVIKANLETIDQLIAFISPLAESTYRVTHEPIFSSSVGQHLRHILDLYLSMMNAGESRYVDYDYRRRGAALEQHKQVGLNELARVRQWLLDIQDTPLNETCVIKTEVMLSDTVTVEMDSTLARELCFVSSHLTHHLAIMAALVKLAGGKVDERIGLAPATASFVREVPAA